MLERDGENGCLQLNAIEEDSMWQLYGHSIMLKSKISGKALNMLGEVGYG